MDIFSIYIATFFIVFLIMPTLYFALKCILWFVLEYCDCGCNRYRDRRLNRSTNRRRGRNIAQLQQQRRRFQDQGNIYTVSDDNTLNSAGGPPRFPAFYYLEPGSEEEARIRAQLEKDERELPSYDEVIRMTTASETVRGDGVAMSTTSIATTATNISLSPCVPPYTEIDMNATQIAPATAAPTTPPSTTLLKSISVNEEEAAASPASAPSTSQAAAAITIASPVTSTSA